MTKIIIFPLLINLFFNDSAAQSFLEIGEMKKVNIDFDFIEKQRKLEFPGKKNGSLLPTNQTRQNFLSIAGNNKNEFDLFFSGLFLFYKFFISSQDVVSCSFSPSCSEFGILSIKKRGFFEGTLSTFDRLMRCHGLSAPKYKLDYNTGLLIDTP